MPAEDRDAPVRVEMGGKRVISVACGNTHSLLVACVPLWETGATEEGQADEQDGDAGKESEQQDEDIPAETLISRMKLEIEPWLLKEQSRAHEHFQMVVDGQDYSSEEVLRVRKTFVENFPQRVDILSRLYEIEKKMLHSIDSENFVEVCLWCCCAKHFNASSTRHAS